MHLHWLAHCLRMTDLSRHGLAMSKTWVLHTGMRRGKCRGHHLSSTLSGIKRRLSSRCDARPMAPIPPLDVGTFQKYCDSDWTPEGSIQD
jgi:hypothetical protein